VPDEDGGVSTLALEHEADAVRERLEVGEGGQRRRAAVAGEVGHDDAVLARKLGRELDPVRGGAAEPVQKHDRSALAADEPAQADALHRRQALREPACRKARCDRHGSPLFC
jgi:hypothetical protein